MLVRGLDILTGMEDQGSFPHSSGTTQATVGWVPSALSPPLHTIHLAQICLDLPKAQVSSRHPAFSSLKYLSRFPRICVVKYGHANMASTVSKNPLQP